MLRKTILFLEAFDLMKSIKYVEEGGIGKYPEISKKGNPFEIKKEF